MTDESRGAVAIAMIASRSAGWPAKSTGMMAFVRGVIAASRRAGVDVERVGLDVDEHRRRAAVDDDVGGRGERDRRGDDLVAGPTPAASSASGSAAVHEFTATPCVAPTYAASVLLELLGRGPVVSQPERSISSTARSSSASISG